MSTLSTSRRCGVVRREASGPATTWHRAARILAVTPFAPSPHPPHPTHQHVRRVAFSYPLSTNGAPSCRKGYVIPRNLKLNEFPGSLITTPSPTPSSPTQIIIDVYATALNFFDILVRGLHLEPPFHCPADPSLTVISKSKVCPFPALLHVHRLNHPCA